MRRSGGGQPRVDDGNVCRRESLPTLTLALTKNTITVGGSEYLAP